MSPDLSSQALSSTSSFTQPRALAPIILHRVETLCLALPLAAEDISLCTSLLFSGTQQQSRSADFLEGSGYWSLPTYSKCSLCKSEERQICHRNGLRRITEKAVLQVQHLQENKAKKHFITESEDVLKHLCTAAPK